MFNGHEEKLWSASYDAACMFRFTVNDPEGVVQDRCRTMAKAQYEVRLMNDGAGKYNPHGPLGCKVEGV
jgi:hypothetical protein